MTFSSVSDDAFVREIDDEIARVKQIEEERESAQEELTEKFFKLFSCIRESDNETDLKLATSDLQSLPSLYAQYGIS